MANAGFYLLKIIYFVFGFRMMNIDIQMDYHSQSVPQIEKRLRKVEILTWIIILFYLVLDLIVPFVLIYSIGVSNLPIGFLVFWQLLFLLFYETVMMIVFISFLKLTKRMHENHNLFVYEYQYKIVRNVQIAGIIFVGLQWVKSIFYNLNVFDRLINGIPIYFTNQSTSFLIFRYFCIWLNGVM